MGIAITSVWRVSVCFLPTGVHGQVRVIELDRCFNEGLTETTIKTDNSYMSTSACALTLTPSFCTELI